MTFRSRRYRSRRFRSVLGGAAIVLALTSGLALQGNRQAEASCGPLSDKSISGTIAGDDGRAVNAVVGFTFVDIFGYRVDARGCRLQGDAYGRSIHVNSTLPATGGVGEAGWSNDWWIDRIPANVRDVWVETYPKGPDGKTDYNRYAGIVRPRVLPGTRNLTLRFPVTCANGGKTGAIRGTMTVKGKRVTPSWIGYWSENDTSPQMGYAIGGGADGGYVSPPLSSSPPAPGKPQAYQLMVSADGVTYKYRSVPVYPCRTTTFNIVER